MSDERDERADYDEGPDVPISPEGRRAEDAVRGLAPPRADAAFRQRLQERFVGGTLEGAPAETPGTAGRGVEARRPGPRRRPPFLVLGGALAAAAVLAIVLLRPGAPRQPEWTVVAVTGEGTAPVRVGGRVVALADLLREGGIVLHGGDRVELPESTAIELRWANVLAVETVVGSAFSVPAEAPGGAEPRGLSGRVEHGEVRYVTGPGFPGRTMRISSDEATIDVIGTTFAVIRDSSGTCVCVEEGMVRFTPRDGSGPRDVPAGRRRLHFNDGRPPEEIPLPPNEQMKLGMLRDRARPELQQATPPKD